MSTKTCLLNPQRCCPCTKTNQRHFLIHLYHIELVSLRVPESAILALAHTTITTLDLDCDSVARIPCAMLITVSWLILSLSWISRTDCSSRTDDRASTGATIPRFASRCHTFYPRSTSRSIVSFFCLICLIPLFTVRAKNLLRVYNIELSFFAPYSIDTLFATIHDRSTIVSYFCFGHSTLSAVRLLRV
jgi:hypothetical protein